MNIKASNEFGNLEEQTPLIKGYNGSVEFNELQEN